MIESTPLRLTGVEIVTNDLVPVRRLRKATGLKPQTLLYLNGPRRKQACNAARKDEPYAALTCGFAFSVKVNGGVPALFLVEINVAKRAPLIPPTYFATRLASDLTALANKWMSGVFANLETGGNNTEHLNKGRGRGFVHSETAFVSSRKLTSPIREADSWSGRPAIPNRAAVSS